MSSAESSERAPVELPESLGACFWDHDFAQLEWPKHREFIIRRILAAGSWDAVCWLRSIVGDAALRDCIERHRGRWLSAKQLRFWELILDMSSEQVDRWLAQPARKIWEGGRRR